MRRAEAFMLSILVVLALSVVVGPGVAVGTVLYKYTTPSANDKLAEGITIRKKLKTGFSFFVADTAGNPGDTCTSMTLDADLRVISLKVTGFTPSGCTHTTTPLVNADGTYGEWEIKHIAGTTNGTVIAKQTRITVQSTVFGISCTANTGEGTTLGTLTGAKSSTEAATLELNGVVSMGALCGDSNMTGTFEVETPLGLTVEAT